MNKRLIVIVCFMLCLGSGCDKSSTKPDLEDEAENVPWALITGKIAFTRTIYEDGITDILFIMDAETKRIDRIRRDSDLGFSNPAWKYDGSLMAFSSFDMETYNWQLHTITPDGDIIQAVFSADAHCNYPAWSRDGRLAYWYNGFWPDMYEIRIDGRMFFNKAGCDMSRPAWSPDGAFLVISMADSCSQGSLYKVSVLDTTVTPLMVATGDWDDEIFHSPVYSPDGNKVACMKFGNSVENAEEIWIVNADGSNPERLTSGHVDYYPSWSPDGKSIAFSRSDQVEGRIMIIDLETRTETELIKGSHPCWIP
ncbi:PD40 domain-containing protein [bacterium]|nr:PD40 domain-containing protein [bacterium]